MVGLFCLFMLSVAVSSLQTNLTTPMEYSSMLEEINKLRAAVNILNKKVDAPPEYCRLLPNRPCGPCLCTDDNRLLQKYFCDCQNISPKRDCLEHYQHGSKVNGVYKINQNGLKTIQVYCDQTTDGGGWTVIQRRRDGSVKFYRDWANYKVGFGDLQNEFWLGNENLFTMSLQGLYPAGSELRIELQDWSGQNRYAKYSNFQTGNELTKYQMNVGGYVGNAGEGSRGMMSTNGYKFSTFDRDNDVSPLNCAAAYKGGWWYANCHYVNLNGRYYDCYEMGSRATGIHWWPFHGHDYPLKFVEMKTRRVPG